MPLRVMPTSYLYVLQNGPTIFAINRGSLRVQVIIHSSTYKINVDKINKYELSL